MNIWCAVSVFVHRPCIHHSHLNANELSLMTHRKLFPTDRLNQRDCRLSQNLISNAATSFQKTLKITTNKPKVMCGESGSNDIVHVLIDVDKTETLPAQTTIRLDFYLSTTFSFFFLSTETHNPALFVWSHHLPKVHGRYVSGLFSFLAPRQRNKLLLDVQTAESLLISETFVRSDTP